MYLTFSWSPGRIAARYRISVFPQAGSSRQWSRHCPQRQLPAYWCKCQENRQYSDSHPLRRDSSGGCPRPNGRCYQLQPPSRCRSFPDRPGASGTLRSGPDLRCWNPGTGSRCHSPGQWRLPGRQSSRTHRRHQQCRRPSSPGSENRGRCLPRQWQKPLPGSRPRHRGCTGWRWRCRPRESRGRPACPRHGSHTDCCQCSYIQRAPWCWRRTPRR